MARKRRLQPCGTPAAYKRHLKRHQVPCYACSRAWADYEYLRRRGTPVPKPPALHHTSGTDLWPLIGALAEALLGGSEQERAA